MKIKNSGKNNKNRKDINIVKVNVKKDWKGQKNLLVVDVSAVMRTKHLPLFSEQDRMFNPRLRYARKLSYEVDGEEVNTSAIFGLMQLFQMYGVDNDYIFCFDAPNNLLKTINKNYKNNRVKMGDEYYDQVNTVYKWLTEVGYRTMFLEGYEGDHHIHKAVRDNLDDYDNIGVITNDKDLSSLVTDKVVWIDTLKKRPDITVDNYPLVVGCPYNMVNLYKATVGDTSDNIKGIYRFGDKRFMKMIDEDGIYPLGADVLGREEELIRESNFLNDEQKNQALESLKLVLPLEVPDTVKSKAVPSDMVDIFGHKMYLQKFGIKSIDKLFKVDL